MFQDWPRCIACVDMNAFFAAVEAYLTPSLRHKPIAVTNGSHGSCIITSSYAARAYGIKTGMRFSYARALCPSLEQVQARATVYATFSKRLMQLLYDEFTPDIEVFSIDEAFLDFTYVYHRYATPRLLATAIRDRVYAVLGLPCSVGIAGDKTTAKYAAKQHKPFGVSVIAPDISAQILAPVSVQALCGIGPKTSRYLARYGALVCGEVRRIPVSVLSKKFGIKGQRLWLMCSGRDPDLVRAYVKPAKSMGHSKILPPGVRERSQIHAYLSAMAFKLSYRMHLHQQRTHLFVCKVHASSGSMVNELVLPFATNDHAILSLWIDDIVASLTLSSPIRKVQVMALHLTQSWQQDIFYADCALSDTALHGVQASINQRFGDFTVKPARLTHLLAKLQSTQVISPAWKGAVPKCHAKLWL